MPLIIDDPEFDRKVHTIANALGKTVEETLRIALDRVELPTPNEPARTAQRRIDWAEVRRILAEVDKLPRLDERTADEIIGYNEHGHFD